MSSASGSRAPTYIAVVPLPKRLTIVARLNGKTYTLVDTTSAVQLAESNHATRYYFDKSAVQRPFQVKKSESRETYCPYKGFACYYDLLLDGEHVDQLTAALWSYIDPFPGSDAEPIGGLVCLDAPSNSTSDKYSLELRADQQLISVEQAKKSCNELLSKYAPARPAPSQPREVEEDRRRAASEQPTKSTQHRLMPPTLKRTTSSASADPQMFPASRALGSDLHPDSSNPMLADLVYHLDDEAREGHDVEPIFLPAQKDDQAIDEHLAWFKDQPWYRKPSYKWLRPFAFLISMAGGMCMGPKIELLNMFVCEKTLGDPYVDGGISTFAPPSQPDGSTTNHTMFPAFQPWNQSDSVTSSSDYYSDAVDAFFASLDAPNSTVIPAPKRPSKECYKSPEVQSALAKLQLRMTLSMGVLAALTTGYWSNLSSRLGRLPVLRISMFGIICTDILMLSVALIPRSSLPFGYNFLVLGTTLEGLLGGYSTAVAVHQSYISDVTPSGTRAHIFSHFLGVVWAGLGLGPTIGGLVVKRTNYILAPFWFALVTHVLYVIGVFTFIPESTSEAFRLKAAKDYKEAKGQRRRQAEERKTAELQPLLGSRRNWQGEHKPFEKRLWKWVKVTFMNSFLYAPLEPLSFLLPKKVSVSDETFEGQDPMRSGASTPQVDSLAAPEASASHISVSHVPSKMRYDCNLFFLSLTYFVESAYIGILPYKMQYAQELFLWGAPEIGMYLTFSSIARVISLALVLPVTIKMLHRPVQMLRLPQDGTQVEHEDGDLAGIRRRSMLDDDGRAIPVGSYGAVDQSNGDSRSMTDEEHREWDHKQKSVEELWTLRAKHLRLIHDSKFDLKLSLISIYVNTAAYVLLVFAKTPGLFLLATAITALGGGGGAAMSSLALAMLESPSQAGKLFGAWSILSAIAGTVVGPVLFAEVFERTTRNFPEAIFVVAAGLFALAIVMLYLVKVRKPVSLPSLPPRPQPIPSSDASDQPTSGPAGTNTFRASTWKSAMSLKTSRQNPNGADDGLRKKSKRSALPNFD